MKSAPRAVQMFALLAVFILGFLGGAVPWNRSAGKPAHGTLALKASKAHLVGESLGPLERTLEATGAISGSSFAQRVLVVELVEPAGSDFERVLTSLRDIQLRGELDEASVVGIAIQALCRLRTPLEALELLESLNSKSAGLYEQVGRALEREGLETMALEVYGTALTLAPANSGRRNRSLNELLIRDPARAVALLENARAERPGLTNSTDFRKNLAVAWVRVGRLGEAEELIVALVEKDADDRELLGILASANPLLAEAHYRALFEADPKRWTNELSSLLMEMERTGEAVDLLCARLVDAPRNLDLIDQLGECLPGLARQYLLEAYPLVQPEREVANQFSYLGNACLEAGDTAGAIANWTQSVLRMELSSNGTLSWEGDFEELAPEMLIKALEARCDANSTPAFLDELATLYWGNGDPGSAMKSWRENLARFPGHPLVSDRQANLDAAAAGLEPPWL